MPKDDEQRRLADERLSALVDGELDAAAMALACGDWREDGESRATWHAYQLIGDVLRSEDLASHAGRDAGFLATLRTRLADEPVVLAPERDETVLAMPEVARVATAGRARGGRWNWRSSSAVAAGFVVVAGALVMTRSNDPRADAPEVASIAPPAPAAALVRNASNTVVATTPAQVNEPQTLVANGQVIRDARLDRYLAAHKQFAGTSALGIPSAYLRSATAESGDR